MSRFEAVYIKADPSHLRARMREISPADSAELRALGGWVVLTRFSSERGRALAHALATGLATRAIAVTSQTVVGHVELCVFSASGNLTRHLVFTGGGDGWEVVAGTRQRWERELFSGGALDPTESAADEEAKARQRLVAGARIPSVDLDLLLRAMKLPSVADVMSLRPAGWVGRANPSRYTVLLVAVMMMLPIGGWMIMHFMTIPSSAASVVFFLLLGAWGWALHAIRRFAASDQLPSGF
ncbi:MAG: hypothetical protein AAF715_31325 [Myxococcota bacterium]